MNIFVHPAEIGDGGRQEVCVMRKSLSRYSAVGSLMSDDLEEVLRWMAGDRQDRVWDKWI